MEIGGDLLLAEQVVPGYEGLILRKWARVDSNYRPHAYQAP